MMCRRCLAENAGTVFLIADFLTADTKKSQRIYQKAFDLCDNCARELQIRIDVFRRVFLDEKNDPIERK